MSVQTRIRRRETHSSRSGAAIVVAVVLALALAALVTEVVLAALAQRPLLLSPADAVRDVLALDTVDPGLLGASGGVLALLGVVLLVLALKPGRRPRHVLADDRAVLVVDDEVVASALVRVAAGFDGVSPDRAVGSVSRRRAVVRITPSSGVPVDAAAVRSGLQDRIAAWGLAPALSARVVIGKDGKVGA